MHSIAENKTTQNTQLKIKKKTRILFTNTPTGQGAEYK
jgi:hypothetical protein